MSDEKLWLNGKPYYCALCGAGGGERMACEMPDCKLESEAEAKARQVKHLAETRATPFPGDGKIILTSNPG